MIWIVVIISGFILFVYLIQLLGIIMFKRQIESEISEIYAHSSQSKPEVLAEKHLEELPVPVQKYLLNSGIIGSERIKTARLKQSAKIRMSEKSRWFHHTTEQYFNAENPAFIWYANMPLFAGLSMRVRDKLFRTKGEMLIKLFSIFKVARIDGPKIDQGALARFVGEMTWFPSAFLYDYCKWEPLDDYSAKLNVLIDNVEVNGIFRFDENYNLKTFECPRWKDIHDDKMEKYLNYFEELKTFNGIKVPSKGKAVWALDDGEFVYWDGIITTIEYNNPELY